jgi:poly(A) polymerase
LSYQEPDRKNNLFNFSSIGLHHLEWVGLVESKIRILIGNLERNPVINRAHINIRKYTKEEEVEEEKPVASPKESDSPEIEIIEEKDESSEDPKVPTSEDDDAEESNDDQPSGPTITTMWFIGLQFNKAEGLNVDLTYDIKAFMDIVYRQATQSNIFKEGMTIEAKYVRRKELPEYLPPDILPLIKQTRKNVSTVGGGGIPVGQLKETTSALGHQRAKTDPGPLTSAKRKSPSPATGAAGRSRLLLPPPKNPRAEPGPMLTGNEDVIPLSNTEPSPHSESPSQNSENSIDFTSDSLEGAPQFAPLKATSKVSSSEDDSPNGTSSSIDIVNSSANLNGSPAAQLLHDERRVPRSSRLLYVKK